LALINLQKKVHALQGAALQLAEPVFASPPLSPVAMAGSQPFRASTRGLRRQVHRETAEHKSAKTLAAYRLTVRAFSSLAKKEHIEDINREDLLSYIAALRKKGSSPRTIRKHRSSPDFLSPLQDPIAPHR
jgi:hypothetical protein